MIPVMCRTRHDPPDSYGDCLRACIASVLELDAELVPHFADGGVDPYEAWRDVRRWLAVRGFTVYVVNYPPVPLDELLNHIGEVNPDCHYLLMGDTGEGSHVVVAKGNRIDHNPAWHGGGLVKPLNDGSPDAAWPVWVIAHR